ncbi:hypothetical protein HN51_071010, partial [Arachis hypogaea]
GWFECITRLVSNQGVQQKILEEQVLYKAVYGLFRSDFAKFQRKKISPMVQDVSAIGVYLSIFILKKIRLGHERMESLVFIKYNQQFIERYNLKDEVDPIALNDINECNEWLVGEIGTAIFRDDDNVDDDADLVH